ncbi:DUF4189 domain-containing protein [Eikenella sp. S3360]|uniref:DUF4189 domain-containing protein n=1 Tax=Eikenella glucosivorans TaxID=2766967 RepID=A0ABS0ND77_9NEIS|nr:DUF4189 domain-containing protein [Eikenella glucosivorans]MBH5330256.1 DUF4189 domain-containing protein [Eikenella glucosivorans]
MKKIILPALLAFGCLTASQFAAADNAANLREHQRQMQHAGYCTQMYGNPSCIDNSRGGGSYDSDSGEIPGLSNLPPPKYFGAIAADKNNAISAGLGYSKREAMQAALQRCGEYGSECRVLIAGKKNQCVSIATGRNASGAGFFFHETARTADEAKRLALSHCQEKGFTGCKERYTIGSSCMGNS